MNNKDLFINDLYLFYRYFIASDYTNSVPAPHIKTLAHELMKLMVTDEYHRLAVSMPPRHLLADSTPILTHNRGWTTHGDLKIGDYVYGLDGKPTKIIGISPKQECDRLVSFSNGEQILAHKQHLWSVHKRGRNEKDIQTLPTEEIEKNIKYLNKNGKGNKPKWRYRYHLPIQEPIQCNEKDLPIDPYWLGRWLGDGKYDNPIIFYDSCDDQFLKTIPYKPSSTIKSKNSDVLTSTFGYQGIMKELKQLNLYKNKHIPQIYKESSIEQRLQLLSGLIDSDGSVDEKGRVRFINTNKNLIKDYYELCTGLALYPYKMTPLSPQKQNQYKKNDKWNIKAKKTAYSIGFLPRYEIPTTIPRKKITENGLRRRIAITDIKKIEDSEMGHCIEVEAEDGIYLVGETLIPTHNSKSSMVTLAFPLWLIFQNPNRNILIVTTGGLTEKFGIKIREYVREYGEHFNCYLSDVKQASTYIMFCDKTGKLYKGSIRLTGMGGSVTGQDADVIILDDPYKGLDEEFTPTALQKKIDYAERVLEQRIEPHTRYCVLHTRWNPINNDCPVLTTKGWKTHGTLEEGDYVFTPSGKPTKITKIHPKTLVDNCFEFNNGDKIISGDHHLWKVYDWGNRKTRLMETHEIMKRQTLIGTKQRSNFLVDVNEPLEYPYQEVPIDPYWLGLWLGDGHHKRPSISVDDNDTISTDSTPYDVVRYDKIKGNCLEAFYTHQGLLEKLRRLNLYGDKHIPHTYLHNSVDVRLNLLAGLIDSDGHVEPNTNRIIFVNTNEKLLKGVYELMESLGFNVKVRKETKDKINEYKQRSDSLQIKSNKDCYQLRITPHIPIPTKLPRKQIQGDGKPVRIGIIDKYKVEPVEGNCITVEAEDGMYLVGKNLTPTHNSHDLIGHYRETQPHLFKFINFSAIQENGEPLWKEKYTITELLTKKQNMGDRMFSAIYQQIPLDMTSDFFKMENIKHQGLDEDETIVRTVRSWDIAGADNMKGDYTCGALLSLTNKDNILLHNIVHGKFGQDTSNVIRNTAVKDGKDVTVLLETGVAGAGYLLFQSWKEQLKGFRVEQCKPVKSKVDRATPLRNVVFDGQLKLDFPLGDGNKRVLLDEFSSFPNGEHDDIVDAVSWGVNWLKFEFGGGRSVKPGLVRIRR